MREPRLLPRVFAVLAAGALVLGVSATASAHPDPSHSIPSHAGRPLGALMTGAAETQPADPDGTGTARIWVNYGQRRVCWSLSVSNITLPATGAHIHRGAVGIAGDIVVPLSAPDATGKSQGCTTVTRQLAKELIQHPARFYVNVHTTDFPNGAIRGQLGKGFKKLQQPSATLLKITKTVAGNTTGWAGGTFGFTVTCGATSTSASIVLASGQTSGSTTVSGLTAGASCTVAETATPAPGTNASWTGTTYAPSGGVTTIMAGTTVTVTVTDTRAVTPGSLTITKNIVGNLTGWAGGTFSFTVTCNDGSAPTTTSITMGAVTSAPVTVNGLTAGATCTVAETALAAGSTWGSPTYSPSATATIVANGNVTVIVTNTRV